MQAVGNIDGTLSAEAHIGTVTAGGAIGATLIAPDVETPVANDTSLAQTTPPALPASIKAEILAEAALARDPVFADYDTLAEQLLTLDADVKESLATGASEIAELRAEILQSVAETRAAAVSALQTSQAALKAGFADLQEQVDEISQLLRAVFNATGEEFILLRDIVVAIQNQAYRNAQSYKTETNLAFAATYGIAYDARVEALTASTAARIQWNKAMRDLTEVMADGFEEAWHASVDVFGGQAGDEFDQNINEVDRRIAWVLHTNTLGYSSDLRTAVFGDSATRNNPVQPIEASQLPDLQRVIEMALLANAGYEN